MTNRLVNASSPYLRQHAHNPVEWYEWGPEAFAEATRRDVPILLSVGYAACHWCHVMAHESFEDAELARQLNENFVAVKVDREERPDIDAVYMDVTQALTGRGGWPMTVFLTPTARPLYAGTYFAPDAFRQILTAMAEIWRTDRQRAEETAEAIVNALTQAHSRTEPVTPLVPAEALDQTHPLAAPDVLAGTVTGLQRDVDATHGGFGTAPKFPPSMTLMQLLRHSARTATDPTSDDDPALELVDATCTAMARGGMYDQLDGGFCRYSVDEAWVVPHFEKMLYDNAQLLRVYTQWYRQTGSTFARRIAHETGDFMLRRLLTEEGALASALDADTEGIEGATYVWSPSQLLDALGEPDAIRAARLLGVKPIGTFERGMSTLQLQHDPSEVFTLDCVGGNDPDEWWTTIRETLRQVREQRPQPARDDKVVTSWNGLAVSALAEAGMVLDEPTFVTAARRIADYLLKHHLINGRLRRSSLAGQVGHAVGVADDYGNLAEGLLVLHQVTGEARYLAAGVELLTRADEIFIDETGVFDTAIDAEQLFLRPRSGGDNAEPCGASSLASASVLAFALTNEPHHRDRAIRCLNELTELATRNPRFAGWALAAGEALASGPVQVAIVTTPDDADSDELRQFVRAAWESGHPGMVVVSGMADAPGAPLLAGRSAGPGVRAYVCRGFVCDAPVETVEALRETLRKTPPTTPTQASPTHP